MIQSTLIIENVFPSGTRSEFITNFNTTRQNDACLSLHRQQYGGGCRCSNTHAHWGHLRNILFTTNQRLKIEECENFKYEFYNNGMESAERINELIQTKEIIQF